MQSAPIQKGSTVLKKTGEAAQGAVSKVGSMMSSAAKGVTDVLKVQEGRTGQLKFALLIIVALAILGLIIWGLVELINYATDRNSKRSTKKNNATILNDRIQQITPGYDQRKDKMRTYDAVLSETPSDQRVLANYHVLTTNVGGYLGPAIDGVFSERDAIVRAFDLGVRHFVLPIDYLNENPDIPRLVVRDSAGWRKSNNTGSIAEAIKGINDVRLRNQDPILITLYFHRLPGVSTTSKEALDFMARVGRALVPLAPHHMGLTSEGDYRRQGMKDALFMKDLDWYGGKVLVFTNVDTAGFRQTKYKTQEDLDLWTHLRLYSHESPSVFNVSQPEKTEAIYGVLDSLQYYVQIPKDQETATVDQTRLQFSMTMGYDSTKLPELYQVARAKELGVQSVGYDIFTDIAENAGQITKALGFDKGGFVLKKEPLRYKRTRPIVADVPSPQLNANGGIIPTPTIS
jgi:hypothetical protein